jgi:hypothetical protein
MTLQLAPAARKRILGIYAFGGLMAGLLGLSGLYFRLVLPKPSLETLFPVAITVTGFSLVVIATALGLAGSKVAFGAAELAESTTSVELPRHMPSFYEKPVRSDTRAPRSGQSGQGLVELALLLPFLVLLLAGIVDLGRGFRALTLITSAASQGAQYGTFNPNDASGIRARVTNALEGSGIAISYPNACPDICITFPGGTASGQPIRIQVQHQLDTILGSVLGFGAIPIQGANQAIVF